MLAQTRWYIPQLARWMSKDLIKYDGGDNVYSYVMQNPVRWVDPSGLNPWDDYDEASEAAKEMEGPHNGIGDAYRHCLASCLVAEHNSNAVASSMGWFNEQVGDVAHNQEYGEHEMDDNNNEMGRFCAKLVKDASKCSQVCNRLATRNMLDTYENGSTSGYWY